MGRAGGRRRDRRDAEVRLIPLKQVRVDSEIQQRIIGVDAEVAREYAEALQNGAEFPPAVVYRDGKVYWLADGFHREAAHRLAGRKEIEAEVRTGTRRDAILCAAGTNAAHGLRRTNADKRRAVVTLLADSEWGVWSDGEIARSCAVSQPFVSKLRRGLVTQNDSELSSRRYRTRHGTEAVMETARIGRENGRHSELSGPPQALVEGAPQQPWLDQILCGDAVTELARLPDESVHLTITSPPYNVSRDYDFRVDAMPYRTYLDWLGTVWEQVARVLVPGGRLVVNVAPTGVKDFTPIHHDIASQLRAMGLRFRAEIIWDKDQVGKRTRRTAWGSFRSPSSPHVLPAWEYVLVFQKGDGRLEGDRRLADITKDEFIECTEGLWRISPENKRRGHPAPFPEELVRRLVKFYSYRANVILDPFGGVGTVATVARRTWRHFVHIDNSRRYCEVASERVAAAHVGAKQ